MLEEKIWGSLHPFYEGGEILGRKVANQSFLDALLLLNPFSAYHFFLAIPENVESLTKSLQANYPKLWQKGAFKLFLHRELIREISSKNYYAFHLSDPFVFYTELSQIRNAFSKRIFPISAPIHSLSYSHYGQNFLKHLWGGVTPRDVVVASSKAGQKVVENYYASAIQNYALDPTKFKAPALYHIPLGVEPKSMPSVDRKLFKNKKELTAKLSQKIEIQAEEVVFLVFARISYQSKMDLIPLLRAFKVAESLGLDPAKYHLVIAGWAEKEDSFVKMLKKFADNLKIKCSIVTRPDNEERKELYGVADVFVSPADNLQETFGLTILEAAVSALPVIASDFNGYKDLVLHKQSGFLIPTLGASSLAGVDAACPILPDAEYHLTLAQECVVEIEALAKALYVLGTDKNLRLKMGAKGRELALKGYTWEQIVQRYVKLWDDLNKLEITEAEKERLRKLRHPAYPSYACIFGSYYTELIDEAAKKGRQVIWSKSGEALYRNLDSLVIYQLVEDKVSAGELKKLLFNARKVVSLSELQNKFASLKVNTDKDFLLLWALKQGLLKFID